MVLLEVIQKDATGGCCLSWQRICSIFSAVFYDSSAAGSQNEEWPKNPGQLWKLQSLGISLVCGEKSAFRIYVFMLLILVNILWIK